ncbi:MAG: hypothetical protein QW292_08160 [Candidatus Parvarchaeota archaeon]
MDGNIKSGLEFWIKKLEANDFVVRNIASQLDPELLAGTTARRSHGLFNAEERKEMRKWVEFLYRYRFKRYEEAKDGSFCSEDLKRGYENAK